MWCPWEERCGCTRINPASKVAKALLEFGGRLDKDVMQMATSPKMVTLLMHYDPFLPFQKSIERESDPKVSESNEPSLELESAFERFMKHSPSSALAVLDQGIGTNYCDPESPNFVVTMDIGYFNDFRTEALKDSTTRYCCFAWYFGVFLSLSSIL